VGGLCGSFRPFPTCNLRWLLSRIGLAPICQQRFRVSARRSSARLPKIGSRPPLSSRGRARQPLPSRCSTWASISTCEESEPCAYTRCRSRPAVSWNRTSSSRLGSSRFIPIPEATSSFPMSRLRTGSWRRRYGRCRSRHSSSWRGRTTTATFSAAGWIDGCPVLPTTIWLS